MTLGTRILLGVSHRILRRTRLIVWRAPRTESVPSQPAGFRLLRISGDSGDESIHLADQALAVHLEPWGTVRTRLAHGDEFFGWQFEGQFVSYGWVTYKHRKLGPIALAEKAGRAFLYDFHTLSEYRGRKLYPMLLMAMRFHLGCRGIDEFIIDVDVRNKPSIKGIQNGGFSVVARVAYLTFFTKWICLGTSTLLEPSAASLFPSDHTAGR
jgi:hypothetical protein